MAASFAETQYFASRVCSNLPAASKCSENIQFAVWAQSRHFQPINLPELVPLLSRVHRVCRCNAPSLYRRAVFASSTGTSDSGARH